MMTLATLGRRLRSRAAAIAHDVVAVPIAWLGAYFLRFNLTTVPEPYVLAALKLLPVVVLAQVLANGYFGLYRGVWRFASIPDVIRIAKAVTAGVALVALAAFLVTRLNGVPRSVPLLYGMLLVALLAGDRLVYRIFKDRRLSLGDGERVLIIGCGSAGEMLVRDMQRGDERAYVPIGFLDDNDRRHGQEVHGVRIFGGVDQLAKVCADHAVQLIIIAVAGANAEAMRRIVMACEATKLPFRTIPGLNELVSGDVAVSELRPVLIEDLLGREAIKLDTAAMTRTVAGRTILVTGGGGSIGSELCRQIARFGPRRLVIADHSEYNLYRIVEELKDRFRTLELVPKLINVADEKAFRDFAVHMRPDVLFHSAAYKHVPLLETHVREAVINNVGGTLSASRAAEAAGCSAFVLISTDKAVDPGNIMGRTKRTAELLCKARSVTSPLPHTIVRFGNVLDSAGSVVPLFRQQIARGGPVTVTHPEMTRFFMTIPEAAHLIVEACALGKGQDVFVLDMGEPVSVLFLAEQMVRLSGKEPNVDIPIEITGLRPGEKMHEALFYDFEQTTLTGHDRIFRAVDPCSYDAELLRRIEALVTTARQEGSGDAVEAELCAITDAAATAGGRKLKVVAIPQKQ